MIQAYHSSRGFAGALGVFIRNSRLWTLGGRQTRRRLVPGIALPPHLVAVVEQGVHTGGIEILLVFDVKVGADVPQMVVQTILLRGQVKPVQIAQSLGLDQRGNGAPGDGCYLILPAEGGAQCGTRHAPILEDFRRNPVFAEFQ